MAVPYPMRGRVVNPDAVATPKPDADAATKSTGKPPAIHAPAKYTPPVLRYTPFPTETTVPPLLKAMATAPAQRR